MSEISFRVLVLQVQGHTLFLLWETAVYYFLYLSDVRYLCRCVSQTLRAPPPSCWLRRPVRLCRPSCSGSTSTQVTHPSSHLAALTYRWTLWHHCWAWSLRWPNCWTDSSGCDSGFRTFYSVFIQSSRLTSHSQPIGDLTPPPQVGWITWMNL